MEDERDAITVLKIRTKSAMILRIALVFPSLFDVKNLQGSRRRVLDLALGFSKFGHEATIFTRLAEGYTARERYFGADIVRLKEFNRLQFGARVEKYVDLPFAAPLFIHIALGYDAMISMNRMGSFIVPFSGKKVLNLHSGPPFFSGPKNTRVQAILRADLAICVSRFLADLMMRLQPGLAKRFTFVHNGVECGLFENGNGRRVRDMLKIPDDHITLLFVGQIGEAKGVTYLIQAFKKLHAINPKAALVIVGSVNLWGMRNPKTKAMFTAYQEGLLKQAQGLPVHFTGLISPQELPDFYSAADIFVNPSLLQETFSLVNLEAMASGKPVVSSGLGGIPEVVRDGQTGFLVPAADADALFSKIELLASNPDLRKKMGEAGGRLARSDFSLDNMISGYIREIGR